MLLNWAPHNIRVHVVAPTYVLTNLTRDYLAGPKYKAGVLDNTPLRCIATVEEIAAATNALIAIEFAGVTEMVNMEQELQSED